MKEYLFGVLKERDTTLSFQIASILLNLLLEGKPSQKLWSLILKVLLRSRATMFFKEKIFERLVNKAFFHASEEVKQHAW